ncbi:MAG: PAS domain-containing sensor histidine kinase, partial [Bacteroidota bacterium]|nr:PAS domain-containing sensor histidine kinase [Bacteroidota bacterium]
RKIGSNPQTPQQTAALEFKFEEYHDLLRSNAELDKRIKQQIAESNESALKYDTVMSALHEGIIIQDADGVVQSANHSAEGLIGMTIHQMCGLTSMDANWGAVYEDGRPMAGEEHPAMRALKTGIAQVNQLMGVKKGDGALVWLSINSQPLVNKETGKILGVVSSFFDVTSARNAKAALEESEKRFRSMMEALPQITFTINANGESDFFNQEWYDFTGMNFELSKGTGWQKAIHPEDLPASLTKIDEISGSNKFEDFEMRYKSADGEYRWFLTRLQPVKYEVGGIKFWINTSTDIDDLKKLQQQKDDFISIASHELRTPITSLKASLQLLDKIKADPSNEMMPKLIERANKSTQKVTNLINDLLNVSTLNQGQINLNKTSFNLAQLVNECCNHVSMVGKYVIETTGDLELEVYADSDRIDQVIINFVNNAIKYAPDSKKITIRIEKRDHMARLSVIDKGSGISAKKLPHLFDRYYRADSGGLHYSGLGLGLYICSEIIHKHNGEIGAESKIGEGSTFWFSIPIA